MKTAVSIPEPVFQSAERLARCLGLSRSDLYSTAVLAFIKRYSAESVTERLNQVYGADTQSAGLDKAVERLQFKILTKKKR